MGRPRRKRVIYMICTPDKFSLPMFWADSKEELSRMSGISLDTLTNAFAPSRYKNRKSSKYVMVFV